MRKNKIMRYVSWLAVAGWMGVIFLMSAQTATESGGLSEEIVRWLLGFLYRGFESFSAQRQESLMEIWHWIVRKGAHFTEYAVLAMLVANALRTYGKLRWYLPVAISAAYAVSDEVHQYFVPGRACRLLDMGIDTCGALFGTVVFSLLLWLIKKRKNTAP